MYKYIGNDNNSKPLKSYGSHHNLQNLVPLSKRGGKINSAHDLIGGLSKPKN